MRIALIGIILATVLTACSLPGTQSEGVAGITEYVGSGFTMQVPKAWTSATGATVLSPKVGSIAASLISPDVKYGFSNNLIIIRDELSGMITSARYSQLNNAQTTRNYLEYNKLQDDPIIFSDSDTSRVYVFEAKYNPSTPRLKFIQTAKVCGTSVYLIHFSVALDKSPVDYIALTKSFTCK